MGVDALGRFQLKRVRPFRGLAVDVPTWEDAHGYHRDHQRLHHLALHRAGIVAGLEVVAFDPPDRSVVIHPGVGLDAEGNLIVVLERQRYHIESPRRGTVYVTIRFREIPADFVGESDTEQGQASRIQDGFMVEERHEAPRGEHIELARIAFDPERGAVINSRDRGHPKDNELDLRSRPVSGARPRGEVVIGMAQHAGSGCDRHEEGLCRFIAALHGSTLYAARFAGPLLLGDDLDGVDLVYLTGTGSFELPVASRQALGTFLARGGTVVGDGCHATGAAAAGEFGDAFVRLAASWGRKPVLVGRSHILLAQPYTFGSAPLGQDGGGVILEHDGVVCLTGDYGCTWEGWRNNAALPRAAIRDAHELGVNVIAYAAARKEQHRLQREPLTPRSRG